MSEPTYSYLNYTDLHYIPVDQKDETWASKVLWFNKRNSSTLVDHKEAKKFRDIDRGIIDSKPLKELIDPVVEGEGGTADWFAADWKSNPIYIHLSNITKANIEKIPINLYCKTADGFSKLRQQKENDKIIMRKYFLNFINEKNKELGYPLLKSNEDPYKYVNRMQASGGKPMDDAPMDITDNIKSLIQDNEDMALFNELVYKDAGAIGVEIYTKWILHQNKFARKSEKVVTDIKNHNTATMRLYTDKTTGRPIIEYLDPSVVYVSPFTESDGDDIGGWYIEYDITFRDFVRMFGKNKTREQLQRIFERQKDKLASHKVDWNNCTDMSRDAARIRIGYTEFLTQDCEVFSKGNVKGNMSYVKKDMSWNPSPKTVKAFKSEREEKHYNVWYKCYYIPMMNTENERVEASMFAVQAEDIYDFGKLQDQYRYGNDNSLCKSSLIVWSSTEMSFTQIMERFMPKINLLWQQYQNDLANAMPHGLVFAEELLNMMVTTSDDSAKEGKDSKLSFMRKLKQTGYGVARLLNSDGKVINDGKPFVDIKTGHLTTAMERLEHIHELYNTLRQALGINPIAEGDAPKPRQSLGAIQLSLDAGTSAQWSFEKGYMDMVTEVGNRMLYHIVEVINNKGKRFDELKDIVGAANGMALEALEGIPMQRMAMTIENINTDQAKARLESIANQLVAAQALDVEVLFLLTRIDNYKYAAALMIMKFKERERRTAEAKTLEFNRSVEIKKLDIDFKKQDYINRVDAESTLLELSKKWDEKIGLELAAFKSNSQQALKQITGDNREKENTQKHGQALEEKNLNEIVTTT